MLHQKLKMRLLRRVLNQELLGTLFNNKFDFDEHVTSLCRKAFQKLNALARVARCLNLAERRLIMNAFIFSQFGCYPLLWIFRSRELNINELALRIVWRDYESTFQQLIVKKKYVCIYHRATWMIMSRIFKGNMRIFTKTIKLRDKKKLRNVTN